MLRLMIFALLAARAASDSTPAESKVERHEDDDHNLYLQAKIDGKTRSGPAFVRNLQNSKGHGPDITAQDEIIRDSYSPAYYEPLWVLDYRFLKSGGRKYVRAPGGQILILPKNYVEQPGENARDYDSMVDRLRYKMVSEQRSKNAKMGHYRRNEDGEFVEYQHY